MMFYEVIVYRIVDFIILIVTRADPIRRVFCFGFVLQGTALD